MQEADVFFYQQILSNRTKSIFFQTLEHWSEKDY